MDVKTILLSIAIGLALSAISLLVPMKTCMHGPERGIPFTVLTNRCSSSDLEKAGLAFPFGNDQYTESPATKLISLKGLVLNFVVYLGLGWVVAGLWAKLRKNKKNSNKITDPELHSQIGS